jgi:hypothetical protein
MTPATTPVMVDSLADQLSQSETPSVSSQPEPTIDASAFQNDVLKEHRIAYLIADGAVDNRYVLAPEGLKAGWGAVIIHDWPTLLTENAKAPFEAVIIQRSALSFVDAGWVTAAYRNAVVIALIDIFDTELPILLGFCDTRPPADPGYPANFFLMSELHYTVNHEATYQEIQRQMAQCVPFSKIRITGISGHSRSHESLDGPNGPLFFAGSLQSRLKDGIQRPVIIPTSDPDTTPDR